MPPLPGQFALDARYPSTDAGLHRALLDFDMLCEQSQLDATTGGAVRLAVEELALNVIRHGGQPNETGWFAVHLQQMDGAIRLTISDGAAAFDPTAYPPPDMYADLDARAPGGHGIALVRADGRVALPSRGRHQPHYRDQTHRSC